MRAASSSDAYLENLFSEKSLNNAAHKPQGHTLKRRGKQNILEVAPSVSAQ